MKSVAKAQKSRERDANMMMRGFVKIQTAKVLCLRLQCLERIRADVLKFTTGTERQVNRMRLIDSEMIKIPTSMVHSINGCFMIRVEDVQRIVSDQPTAFDKEKVIDEMLSAGQKQSKNQLELSDTCAYESDYPTEVSYYKGRALGHEIDIEIVEKGGIDTVN